MNNHLQLLKKIYKYSNKLNNNIFLEQLDSINLKKLYILSKNTYINNQKGGLLVNSNELNKFDIINVDFHGSINQNDIFTIPSNIYLIIPLCCGFINFIGEDYIHFFLTNNKKQQLDKINEAEYILKLGKHNYIILKPNQKYCDINLAITYEKNSGIGMYFSQYFSQYFNYNFFNYNKYDVIIFNNDDVKILEIMENIRLENYNVDSDSHEKINEITDESKNNLFINFIYSEIHLYNNDYNEVIKKFKLINKNKLEYINFIKNINNNNLSIDKIDINLLDKKYIDFLSNKSNKQYIDFIKNFLAKIWSKITFIKYKSELEKNYYINLKTEFTLGSVLEYLSKINLNKKLFVFNTSCQGFSSENTCENYKCLKHLKLQDIEYSKVFNQNNIKKIYDAVKILKYYNKPNIFNRSSTFYINKLQIKDVEILENLIIKSECTKNNDLTSEESNELSKWVADILIWYLYKEYKILYDHLIKFNNDFIADVSNTKKNICRQIITMLNLSLTLIYDTLLREDQKIYIKTILDEMIEIL